MQSQDVKIEAVSWLHQGFVSVKRYLLRHKRFDGTWTPVLSRELIEGFPVVAVLPYDPIRDQVVLLEQFRVGALSDRRSPWMFEIVAGLIDHEETPEAVAQREVQEEAGLIVTELTPICEYWSSPGGSSGYVHLFCGRVDSVGAGGIFGVQEEQEDIRAFVVSAEEAFEMRRLGRINNAISLIALLWLELNRDKLLAG